MVANICFKSVVKVKYFKTMVTNTNFINNEIKSRLSVENETNSFPKCMNNVFTGLKAKASFKAN
jgi:hypothetical protein